MAKKKKRTSKNSRSNARKRTVQAQPEHILPDGFWRQIGAILLIAFSFLLILGWFSVGGPVLDWLFQAIIGMIGYSVYVVPVLFIYVAVEVFRAEENRIPFVVKFATALSLIWFSGLFGLLKRADGSTTGGFVGDTVNSGMLAMVNPGVAAFIYVLLILITAIFITRASPQAIIASIWDFDRRDSAE